MRNTPALTAILVVLLAAAVTGCSSSQYAAPTPAQPSATTPSTTVPPTSDSASGSTSQPAQSAGSAQLGKQIFTTGNGADGSPVGVSAGRGGPCMRCHGADAKGVNGPDIRWSVLTGATSSSKAPRFPLADEAQFQTAVTTGVAAGNQLKPMMPHYNLTPAEAAALAAYLKTL